MLCLTRRPGEAIVTDHKIKIYLIEIEQGKVRLGVEAPKTIPVHRDEIQQIIDSGSGRRPDRLNDAPLFFIPPATILKGLEDVTFSAAREGLTYLGFIDMEAGNKELQAKVRFDYRLEYEYSADVNPDGTRDSYACAIASVDVKTVVLTFDHQDVVELSFRLKPGSQAHREWCDAVLAIAKQHEELICEKFA